MCGKPILRYPSQTKKHNFCSRKCLADFSNKAKNPYGYTSLKNYAGMSMNMSKINAQMNSQRMSVATRTKLRQIHLGTGTGKHMYSKYYGRLAHRVAAERKIGRQLESGEVVHHLDFNGKNNELWNLMVFKNHSDHCKYHMQLKNFFDTGKIPSYVVEEVMPL